MPIRRLSEQTINGKPISSAYSSALNQPASVYDYDVNTEESTQIYMKDVPNFQPQDYKVEKYMQKQKTVPKSQCL